MPNGCKSVARVQRSLTPILSKICWVVGNIKQFSTSGPKNPRFLSNIVKKLIALKFKNFKNGIACCNAAESWRLSSTHARVHQFVRVWGAFGIFWFRQAFFVEKSWIFYKMNPLNKKNETSKVAVQVGFPVQSPAERAKHGFYITN